MGTIVQRTRKTGTIGYTAQIRIRREGVIVHNETKTFDREAAARVWMRRREKELDEPGALELAKIPNPALSVVIDRYIAESERGLGKTKAQVLNSIGRSDFGALTCAAINSVEIVAYIKSLDVQPQTRGNYLSHLSAVISIARPAWGYPLDARALADATAVLKKLRLISKSQQRDRRPSLDELDRLLRHFSTRQERRPDAAPMVAIIIAAIFTTRREAELVRITWADFDPNHSRLKVRDMKNPGETRGNDVWCQLPPEAVHVLQAMPKTSACIFPFTTDAIGAAFTRACRFLEIEDLHFHDLRHDGISRLFEMGWTIPQAAGVSGHRSWQSLQRYTHVRQSGDKYAGWAWLEQAAPLNAELARNAKGS